MTEPNRTDPPVLPGVDPRLLEKLDLSVLLLLLLVIVFRTLSAGQESDSATTAFCELLTFLATSLWCLRKLAGRSFSLPSWQVLLPVGFFLFAIIISALQANRGGNIIQARMLAMHWAAEILLFLVILDYARTRERSAVLVCGLLAAVTILIVYGIYQRAYGLQYFIGYVTAQPELAEKIAGSDPVFQGIFKGRLQTPQIYGPYGYANTMAGFLILGLPLLWFAALSSWMTKNSGGVKKIFLSLLVLCGMVALVFTGSRGGMLAAKAAEVIAFLLLARNKKFWRKGICSEVLAVEFVFSLAALLLSLPLLMQAETGWLGELLYGILWSGVIILVAQLCLRPKPVAGITVLKIIGALTTILLLAGIIWTACGAPGGPLKLQEKISAQETAFHEGRNTPAVRWNYWRSGWRMWMRNPWLGVGLDQFSTHYTAYKPISGWAVKRVHNNYLQLAADGGVLLLAAWLLLGLLFFFARLRPEPLPLEKLPEEAGGEKGYHQRLVLFGSITVFCALVLMGFPDPFRLVNLRLPLFFEGMSIEFFINEVSGGMLSQWPHNLLPGLVHLGTHVLLLPLAGVGVFCLSWKIVTNEKNQWPIWQMLRLGILAMLLHALVDFVYYMQVISSTVWVMAALALVQTTAGPKISYSHNRLLGKRYVEISLPLAIIGFCTLLWFWPIAHWQQAQLAQVADESYKFGENVQAKDTDIDAWKRAVINTEQTRLLYLELLEELPQDPEIHRRLSELYLRLLLFKQHPLIPDNNEKSRWHIPLTKAECQEQALRHARLTVKYHDGYAAAHAYLGKTLLRLYPASNRERMYEAWTAFGNAYTRHPYRPEYIYLLGEVEARLGNPEVANQLWYRALELDSCPLLSDARAHLEKELRDELTERFGVIPGCEHAGHQH
ncbi:MAG: O-antigen ligase family protein [Planctomycetes bacterium]|nr:O-antigen ligase family protein [Planctomycetota bacterium]